MPKALFNIAYTLPSPPSNLNGNARAEYQARRNFYNLTADYNYFSYALDGKKVVKNANAEHYFTREDTNTGLFNFDGSMSEDKKAELKAKLKHTKSTIWHGFISFDEDTSRGFNTQENAIKFMKQTFGGFLARAGFKKENIEPYFSLHDDTDHRHIHFAFFEKEPKWRDKNGVLGFRRRGKIDAKAIDNYLVSANMHLSEYGDEYYTARDEAIASLKEVRKQSVKTVEVNQELNNAINRLTVKLPAQGRLSYSSENMRELRPEIDRVAMLLIASDGNAEAAHKGVLKQLARVKDETLQLVKENKLVYVQNRRLSKEEIEATMDGDKLIGSSFVNTKNIDYFERLDADYKVRIGNITIGVCRDLRSRDIEQHRKSRVNNKQLKIRAKNHRRRRESAVASAIKAICSSASNYCKHTDFIKTVQQNEHEIEQQRNYESRAN